MTNRFYDCAGFLNPAFGLDNELVGFETDLAARGIRRWVEEGEKFFVDVLEG